ncbi:tryptophan transporter [Sporolactobacillus sp. CQH2019]|uniref:tryptophan transporter n=1 Tax=Sporolactobacillus sp. CQH2019 TaxID=3023512 RepID=UPI002367425B|nr:tryptophan transporter [Sporolactobacillus sp. CQH2019]MDD9149435.1 tryptophan transporter [Sporolactobacillus sp. CQH2019]
MKLQNLIIVALFLAIGTVLHTVVPGLLFGMKADLLLVMLFLALYFFADRKSFLVIGLVAGILAGLTTNMPGGFFPSVIDKFVTSAVVFPLFSVAGHYFSRPAKYIAGIVLAGLGTALSGAVFLSMMILLAGLNPATFTSLFVVLVLPTAAVNAVLTAVLFPLISRIAGRSAAFRTGRTLN